MKNLMEKFEETFKTMSHAEIVEFLHAHSLRLTPMLIKEFGSAENAVAILGIFVAGAALADGELTDAEYELFADKFAAMFGTLVGRAGCEKLFEYAVDEFQAAFGKLSDFVGCLDGEGMNELIGVLMAMFAVDGNIGESEKLWLKKLIAGVDEF